MLNVIESLSSPAKAVRTLLEWAVAILILGLETVIIFFLLGVIFISLLVSPQ